MSDPQEGPIRFFTDDHRACDDLWGQFEGAAGEGDVTRATELWRLFETAMRRHFEMEEKVLFPALEPVIGMPPGEGPTEVMRVEHQHMRAVIDQMSGELASGDLEAVLDQGDTLLMMTAQHNVREEGVLYTLAEERLSSQWSELADKLREIYAK